MLTMVAWRVRGLGSGRRKPAVVKAERRAVAKGWRWGEEEEEEEEGGVVVVVGEA